MATTSPDCEVRPRALLAVEGPGVLTAWCHTPFAALWQVIGLGLYLQAAIRSFCVAVFITQDVLVVGVQICYSAWALFLSMFTLSSRAQTRVAALVAGVGSEARKAATVGALLAGHAPDSVLDAGLRTLRAIPFPALESDVFASPEHGRRLVAASVPVRLGEVDVFCSHSWRDSPSERWDALTEWCTAFRRRTGRDAMVWLDVVCLDSATATAITCLPVYIMASTSLLMLQGPNFLQRLWCIAEVWVAICLGFSADRLHLRRLPSLPAPAATDAVRAVDVRHATCAVPEDGPRLLEVMNAFPGGLVAFNADLSQRLHRALLAHAGPEPQAAPGSVHVHAVPVAERRGAHAVWQLWPSTAPDEAASTVHAMA